MKKVNVGVLMLVGAMLSFSGCSSNQVPLKEISVQENFSPNQILEILKTGNDRFVNHKNTFPHLNKARMLE